MENPKKIKAIAVALALVFALSAHAAKKKDAPTVQDAVEKIELAIKEINNHSKSKAIKLLNEANGILAKLPEDEEVLQARGYVYRTRAEIELLVNNNEAAFEKNKKLCIENSKGHGAELTYFAAGFYYDVAEYFVKSAFKNPEAVKALTAEANKYYERSRKAFLEGFELDPELRHISNGDINTFMSLSKLKSNFSDVATFYDKVFASKKQTYWKNMGVNAMAIYEITGDKYANNVYKGILISILDFEAMEKPDSAGLIDILEKNFSKYQDAAPCIAFVKKFYSDAGFSQNDLDSLPDGVRDFLPVRYMYKMKTSDDIAALMAEFEPFFTDVKYYQKRLAEKAKAL
ncbi:MAG: hypothetical protein K2N58_04670 [Treponemataceae bacterium]|nr:hypothetical protein [Treponemataceae bacterium]